MLPISEYLEVGEDFDRHEIVWSPGNILEGLIHHKVW